MKSFSPCRQVASGHEHCALAYQSSWSSSVASSQQLLHPPRSFPLHLASVIHTRNIYLFTWYTDCHANGQSVLLLSSSSLPLLLLYVLSEPHHRQRPRCHWLSHSSLLAYIRSRFLRIILFSLASCVCSLRH